MISLSHTFRSSKFISQRARSRPVDKAKTEERGGKENGETSKQLSAFERGTQ